MVLDLPRDFSLKSCFSGRSMELGFPPATADIQCSVLDCKFMKCHLQC